MASPAPASTALLQRVSSFFAEFAPTELADSWDNVGVLIENPKPNKSGVVGVTIDLTPAVLDELLNGPMPAEVIVAYHPPLFVPFKRFTLSDPKQRIALETIAAGASIYSPHTCVDSCRGSINDWLIESIVDGNISNVSGLWPMCYNKTFTEKLANAAAATSSDNTAAAVSSSSANVFDTVGIGAGRVAELAAGGLAIHTIVENLKKHLGVPTARVSLPFGWAKDRVISKVAVCAGSGAGVFKEVAKGADMFGHVELLISGEMGHHDVLAANDRGQAVVLFEHTNTERGYLKQKLIPLMQSKLGDDVRFVLSTRDQDPLVVW